MSLPDRPLPDLPTLETFEQLCHEVSNPLMIISGHAYLLGREIQRLSHLPAHECEWFIAELAAITQAVTVMATQLDVYRAALVDDADGP